MLKLPLFGLPESYLGSPRFMSVPHANIFTSFQPTTINSHPKCHLNLINSEVINHNICWKNRCSVPQREISAETKELSAMQFLLPGLQEGYPH